MMTSTTPSSALKAPRSEPSLNASSLPGPRKETRPGLLHRLSGEVKWTGQAPPSTSFCGLNSQLRAVAEVTVRRRAAEVRAGLRGCVGQGHEPRSLRPGLIRAVGHLGGGIHRRDDRNLDEKLFPSMESPFSEISAEPVTRLTEGVWRVGRPSYGPAVHSFAAGTQNR